MRLVRNKKLTVEDEKNIIEWYLAGKNPRDILVLLNGKFKTRKTVYDVLNKNGISTNRDRSFYNSCDHFYFSSIDTPSKAYVLGIMITDGYVCSRNNGIFVDLQEGDRYIVEFVAKEWQTSNMIKTIHKKDEKCQNLCRASVYSQRMKTDLSGYGVDLEKTRKSFLPLIGEYQQHLIRGVLDGDGCVYLHSNGINPCIRFLGSHYLVSQIGVFLACVLGVNNPRPICCENDIISYVDWWRIEDVEKIFHYLYDEAIEKDVMYMRRKYEKIKNLLCRKTG